MRTETGEVRMVEMDLMWRTKNKIKVMRMKTGNKRKNMMMMTRKKKKTMKKKKKEEEED